MLDNMQIQVLINKILFVNVMFFSGKTVKTMNEFPLEYRSKAFSIVKGILQVKNVKLFHIVYSFIFHGL